MDGQPLPSPNGGATASANKDALDEFWKKLVDGDPWAFGLALIGIALLLIILTLVPWLVVGLIRLAVAIYLKISGQDPSNLPAEDLWKNFSKRSRIVTGAVGIVLFVFGLLLNPNALKVIVANIKLIWVFNTNTIILLFDLAVILYAVFYLSMVSKKLVGVTDKLSTDLTTAKCELVDEIKKAENDLINGILDSTRNILRGFPTIFHKSLTMVTKAESEIILVNFAVNFGEVHKYITTVTDNYQPNPRLKNSREICTELFSADVAKFYDLIQARADTLPTIRILTLTDEQIRSGFINQLEKRDQYTKTYNETVQAWIEKRVKVEKNPGSQTSCHEEETDFVIECIGCEGLPNPSPDGTYIFKGENRRGRSPSDTSYKYELKYEKRELVYKEYLDKRVRFKKREVLNTVRARSTKYWGTVTHEEKFCELDNLPIQILIADKGHKQGDDSNYGCLVFLVGTDILKESEFPVELGFYTELPQVVEIYRKLADSLFRQAKCLV